MTRRKSKLPRTPQRRLIEHFVAGTTARTAAELLGVNRNTATLYYHKLRETITEHIASRCACPEDRARHARSASAVSRCS